MDCNRASLVGHDHWKRVSPSPGRVEHTAATLHSSCAFFAQRIEKSRMPCLSFCSTAR